MQGTDNMAPEKKSSNINIEGIPHTGNLEGDLQELPHIEGTPSVQEFQGLDTSELEQVMPAPETSGALTFEDSERDDFQRKLAAQREYHEQKNSKTTESHTGRNIAIGATSLLLVGGTVAGVVALNNQPSRTPLKAEPSVAGTVVPGETQAPAATKSAESPLASPTNLGPLETAKPTPESKTSNYSVEQLKAMSVEQYNKLPMSDRINLVKDRLDYAQKVPQFFLEGDLYKYDPLEVASPSNTPDSIMQQILYEMQMASSQKMTAKPEDGTPDKMAAQKALSAAFYNVDPSKNNVALEYTVMSEMIQKSSSIFTVSQKFTDVRELYSPKTEVDSDGKKIDIRTITTIADDGKPHTFEVTYTMFDETKGIWQIYKSL